MQHCCFPDLGKEKLCSVLTFGNACFNIVVRINHDNVASRGAVGRTHTVVRLQTRIRRKDGTENFGGFVYVLDLHNGISCYEFFVCSINFSVFLFRLPWRGSRHDNLPSSPSMASRKEVWKTEGVSTFSLGVLVRGHGIHSTPQFWWC